MATSLSAQLSRLAVPESRVLDRDKKRVSLLFQPSEASKLDAELVFALGLGGLDELSEIDEKAFRPFEASLFSETSQRIQRAVLSKEENLSLDSTIQSFLVRLTPYFLLRSAQKCLEWLIFRFYVHQYNVDSLLRLALPYHESNTFVRLLLIVDIPGNDKKWAWLIPFQKAQLPVRRQLLINRCGSHTSFLGFISDMVSYCIERSEKEDVSKLDMVFTFYASVVIGTLSAAKSLDNALISQLMPHIAEGLKSDVHLFSIASYMTVAQLAIKVQLQDSVIRSLLKAILLKLRPETALNGLTTALVMCQTQFINAEVALPKKCFLDEFRECRAEESSLKSFAQSFKDDCHTLAKRHPEAFDELFPADSLKGAKKEFLDALEMEAVSKMERDYTQIR